MKCGASAPDNIGRCTLTHGHTGQHWNAGGEWPRKAHGSEPMHGTIEDVHELQRNVRELAIQLTREGVQLR
jgi:hypothetical protein